MKSFVSAMVLAASLAGASAQVTYNSTTGLYDCSVPNGAFCAGANIIIRCIDSLGHPGNCDDNLDGEPPVGDSYSPCWQPDTTSGQAACTKNCIIYGGSGNYNGSITTVPDCTPTYTVTASTAASTSYPASSSSTITSTYSSVVISGTVTDTLTFTTTFCPATASSNTIVPPPISISSSPGTSSSATPTGGSTVSPGNGTTPAGGSGGSATATPVGPSSTSTPTTVTTNAAIINTAGSAMAVVGFAVAYFL